MCENFGCCNSCCCEPNPGPVCSTCPRLALVCSLPNFGLTPCAPFPRQWPRPPPQRCLRPWIPTSRNAHPPPLCSVALDQPTINRICELRYFCPEKCGSYPPGYRCRTMPPPACAEPLVPSKFMTMC